MIKNCHKFSIQNIQKKKQREKDGEKLFAKSSNSFTLHLHIEVDGGFKNKSKSNCSLFGISQINHDTINLKLTGFLWREREIQQNFCFSVFCYNIFISLAPTRIASGIKSYTRFIFGKIFFYLFSIFI